MKRKGKVGPFIPCEVRAQTGPARATTAVGAWAKAYPLRRRRLRPSGNAYARARMRARGRQCLHPCDDRCRVGGIFFHKHPKLQCSWWTTSVSERQRLRPCDDRCRVGGVFFHKHPKLQRSGDDVCVQATTPASGRRRLDLVFQTLAFFRALAIQTKLFHYLFLKITETMLKMVIQSYFY